MVLYKIKDKYGKVHIILIIAEDVKVSINGVTRFVHYTDKDGVNGVVFGSDTYNFVNFNNDNIDMHVGIDCTTAESFIINSDLFNSLEKEAISLLQLNYWTVESIRKNLPNLYLRDGSESKELLESITSFITSVQDYVGCTTAKVYLDEEQSDSAQCLLYKYYDGVSTIATIISKDDSLRGIVLSTKSGEIVRVSGNAVGLTENGLVKIKRTDNDRYAFAR
jgi:hypothetical protein